MWTVSRVPVIWSRTGHGVMQQCQPCEASSIVSCCVVPRRGRRLTALHGNSGAAIGTAYLQFRSTSTVQMQSGHTLSVLVASVYACQDLSFPGPNFDHEFV